MDSEEHRYPSRGLSPRPSSATPAHNEVGSSGKRSPLPVEDDIMQLARLGEIGPIQNLFDSGRFDATYRDEEGITPLHWAAIKNHYALCHFLVHAGADVNAKGGELSATPVLWAARACNYYIVDFLLLSGADPLRTDDQGFNLMQNATLDGNVYQILLLLHHDVPIDTPDDKGHTSLMWAAYKGYPNCVEILLQWGADVSAADEQGFTALHWALVKGSYGCIQKLVEYGADKFQATLDGKTPSVVAEEMNSTKQWHRALADCGYNDDAAPSQFPFTFVTDDRKKFISLTFFLWPVVVLYCSLFILSYMPIFVGLPLSLFVAFALQSAVQLLLKWSPSSMKHIHHTPWLAGIFAASLFWVGFHWLFRIFPATMSAKPLYNLLFFVCFSSCTLFYALTMQEDPGFVAKNASKSEQKHIVRQLVEARRFDEINFCMKCMVRRPLRSKHCNRCGRCVAKQDHHCPWINNCVAINNHRHFLYYLITLFLGIIILIRLLFIYLNTLPTPAQVSCNIIKDTLCAELQKDPMTVVVVIWGSLQLTWVTMLIITQLLQISRAQTTYENMAGRHGWPNGPAAMVTSALTAGTTSLEAAQLTATDRGPNPAVEDLGRRHKDGCLEQWKKLLGLDIFVATAMYGSRAGEVQAQQRRNVWNRGFTTNCSDFFGDPAPVFRTRVNGAALLDGQPVNYSEMFYPPPRRRRGEGHDYESLQAQTEEV